jgi:hypothetical protein
MQVILHLLTTLHGEVGTPIEAKETTFRIAPDEVPSFVLFNDYATISN